MSSGKGVYWANILLDLALGAVAFSAPATVYAALYSVVPTSASGSGTEASGGSYARKSITNNTTNWPSASGGVKSNGTAITFVTATADWSSGSNMVAAAIYDALTTGNELYFGSLTQSKPVLNGDTAQFAVSAVTVTET
jgi:hypothetical protein